MGNREEAAGVTLGVGDHVLGVGLGVFLFDGDHVLDFLELVLLSVGVSGTVRHFLYMLRLGFNWL